MVQQHKYPLNFSAVLFLLVMTVHSAHAQIPGDISGNGYLTVYDAYLLEQHVAQKNVLSGLSLRSLDANSDGKVDNADVSWIRSHVSENVYRNNSIALQGNPNWILLGTTPNSITVRWTGKGTAPAISGVVVQSEMPQFLRAIIGVESVAGDFVCATRDARLDEIYLNYSASYPLSFSISVGPLSGNYSPVAGLTLGANASLNINPCNILLEWSTDGPYLRATASGNVLADLTAYLDATLAFNTVGEWQIGPDIPLYDGGVFLLSCAFLAPYQVSGNLNLHVHGGAAYSNPGASFSVSYDPQSGPQFTWPTGGNLSPKPIVWQVSGGTSAIVILRPTLKLNVLYFAEGTIGVGPLADFEGTFQASPPSCPYSLTSNASFKGGVTISPIVDQSWTKNDLLGTNWTLFSGNPCQAPPTRTPTPTPSPTAPPAFICQPDALDKAGSSDDFCIMDSSTLTRVGIGEYTNLNVTGPTNANFYADDDWFALASNVPVGASIAVRIDFVNANGDLDLFLAQNCSTNLATSQSRTNNFEQVKWTNTQTGASPIVIGVKEMSGSGVTAVCNSYNMTISIGIPTPTPTSNPSATPSPTNPPSGCLVLTSPNGGEVWRAGQTYQVTWTTNQAPGSGIVELQFHKGGVYQDFVATDASVDSGRYNLTIPISTKIPPGSDYQLRICKVLTCGTSACADFSDANFTILGTPTPTPSPTPSPTRTPSPTFSKTVTRSPSPSPSPSPTSIPCDYAISPPEASYPALGGTGSVSITAPAGCDWVAVVSNPWITFTSSPAGTGSGVVNYTISQNISSSAREGTITIGGQTHVIDQCGALPAGAKLKAKIKVSGAPRSMTPGQSIQVFFTVTNSGNVPWSRECGFRLGKVNSSDPFGPDRIDLPPGVTVAPGASWTFQATLTAPPTLGKYTSTWEMIQEGNKWISKAAKLKIKVVAPAQALRELFSPPETESQGEDE